MSRLVLSQEKFDLYKANKIIKRKGKKYYTKNGDEVAVNGKATNKETGC